MNREKRYQITKERNEKDKKPVGVNVLDITFYKYDEDGNNILNKDGTSKKFRLKSSRFKPLEYLCETISIDDVEEAK